MINDDDNITLSSGYSALNHTRLLDTTIEEDDAVTITDTDHFAIDSITPSGCSSLLRQNRENGIGGINSINTSMTTASTRTSLRRSRSNNRNNNNSQVTTTPNSKIDQCSNRSSRSVLRFMCNGGNGAGAVAGAASESEYKQHINIHDGWSSSFGSLSRSCRGNNKIYQFDDISSLHYDEYGYDTSKQNKHNKNDDDDSISEFFKVPTKQELSDELFTLVEPNTSTSDALKCLCKLRMWGLVADTDPTTTKYLVEFQAVPTLLYFVRGVIEKRRSLKLAYVEKLQAYQHQRNDSTTTNNNNTKEENDTAISSSNEIRKHQQAYVDAANNNELSLHQAMQVIHHYTCFGDGGIITNRKKAFKSLVLKKAILAQLVEIDGVDLLVSVLEEQMQLADTDAVGDKNKKKNCLAIGSQYGHAVSKSIWSILMNVGACEHAVKLLKQTKITTTTAAHHNNNGQQRKQYYSRARRLVSGIVVGLNHRVRMLSVSSKDPTKPRHHIMPQQCRDSEKQQRNKYSSSSSSSWMEDLFVVLCRLVGSKDADDIDDESNNSEKEKENNQHPSSTTTPNHEHDEIRTMLIEMCVVKKCLKALMDEPNTVFGQDPFVTTLAMSFFYTCIRFGDYRYKNLKEEEHQKNHRRRNNNNDKNSVPTTRHYFENLVTVSLDYDRLVEFTLQSIKRFPSHHLIQGTGCLILDSIPISYKSQRRNQDSLVFLEDYCCDSPDNHDYYCSEKGILSSNAFCRTMGLESSYRRPLAASFVSEIVEPCSRCYF